MSPPLAPPILIATPVESETPVAVAAYQASGESFQRQLDDLRQRAWRVESPPMRCICMNNATWAHVKQYLRDQDPNDENVLLYNRLDSERQQEQLLQSYQGGSRRRKRSSRRRRRPRLRKSRRRNGSRRRR